MKKRLYNNNLRTQFSVTEIPSDKQLRTILPNIQHDQLQPIFNTYLHRLQRGKHLSKFSFKDKYLLALDATQYHSLKIIYLG